MDEQRETTDYRKLLEEWREKNPPQPWWGPVLPVAIAIIAAVVLCAIYAEVMMLN